MSRQMGAVVGLAVVASFLMGLVVASTRPPLATRVMRAPLEVEQPLTIASAPAPAAPASAGMVDFASVAARVNAAVVSVDTASRGTETPHRFSRRYSTDDENAPREGSGSGFIIDPSGYILTNDHVITGADRVTVTLADGRSFRAEIVGADPAIDVALLHVSVPDRLPVAPLGNSDNLRVGQWVCAIGNPLGVYAHSVTVGVVSFLGRKVFDLSLDAYIQTDAAITFGNSGGPLINERGEVVGITTAINAQAMSIGFAVPISQVVPILPQLRERGSVARGYIGIGLTSVTPALRQALGLTPDHGALVQDVHPDTPAERAGLRTYDVIVGVDGHDIRSDEALIRYIAGRAPGTLASLRIWRNGTRRSVPVKLTVRAVERVDLTRARPADARPAAQPQTPLGIRVRDLTASDRLRLPESLQGIIVSDVDPAGPARLAQVRVGQIILEVNRESVHSVADYRTLTSRLTPGDAAAILIYDRQTNQQVIDTVVSDRLP